MVFWASRATGRRISRRSFLRGAAAIGRWRPYGAGSARGPGQADRARRGLRASGADGRPGAANRLQLQGDLSSGSSTMTDGNPTPGIFDGMGAYPGPDGGAPS